MPMDLIIRSLLYVFMASMIFATSLIANLKQGLFFNKDAIDTVVLVAMFIVTALVATILIVLYFAFSN